MVRSISIYQPKTAIGERKFNQCHIISKHRKNKIFTKQEGRGREAILQEKRGGEREQGVVILSYNIEQNIRDGEKTSDKSKRTVMVCDDEKDILLAFSIELQTKYNVLTAESGEQCIKKYLDANVQEERLTLYF